MKLIRLQLLVLPLVCLPLVRAQSTVDFNIGGGTAHASSLGRVDINTLIPCSLVASSNCGSTPNLSGFFLGFGGNLMLWKHLGIGAEAKFQPTRQDYLTFQQQGTGVFGDILQSRVTFYDFNAILAPVSQKRIAVTVQGGIGGANVKFYEKFTSSGTVLGNTNQTQFAGSSNHFQLHAGLGIQAYLTDHIFVRPEFDIHYVHNFAQFGGNFVPSAMVWLGYTIGDR